MSDRILIMYALAILLLRDGFREAAIIILTVVVAVIFVKRVWRFIRRIRVNIYLEPLEQAQVVSQPRQLARVNIQRGRRRKQQELGWTVEDFDHLPTVSIEEEVFLIEEPPRSRRRAR